MPASTHGPACPPRVFALFAAAVLALAGCARVLETAPAPTPGDFPALASALAARGITVDRIASGDAGCQDAELARTAIRFWASGADQGAPVLARVYIFGNQAAYDKRRQSVDTCARAWITDPEQLVQVDAAPFVLTAQGPWPATFTADVKAAVREVAARP